MTLSGIRTHTPRTLSEAIQLLSELKDARVMAGGTDLIVDIKQGLVEVRDIVLLQEIEELKGIKKEGTKVRIGASVSPQDLQSSSLIKAHFPALAEAAGSMASPQVRSLATIGGNIASAVPSADLPPILIAADASVELRCSRSARTLLLSEFFTGPRKTVCRAGELLTAIFLPLPPPNIEISYMRFTLREANALAVASVASRLTLKDGQIKKAAIVLGAVAPTPVLALKASEFLQAKNPSPEVFEEAAAIAKEEGKPISDIRGSAWYRKELIQALTRRSLSEAFERSRRRSKKKK
jgi:carbon-monoxide dehydrogenase medium subunit